MQSKQAGLLASPAPLALLSAKIATRKRLFVSLDVAPLAGAWIETKSSKLTYLSTLRPS